jgi:DNA primase
MISPKTIEEIKERANLVEVIGETVALKRQGTNFSGLCPFHAEKTPSFHIRDHGRYYRCFGCGASGNVLSFVMETRGLSFPEAVEELATRFGVEVRREGRASSTERGTAGGREVFFKVNALAQRFFVQQLKEAEPVAARYLVERGLRPETITEFGIGFAPRGRAALVDFLRSHKAPLEVAIAAGLVRRNARGEVYDGFRGRLIFPIMMDRKHIAGFGGRVIPALVEPEVLKTLPKYLNSPENPAYQKNKILYGLPQALHAIRDSAELYLVEGYMDVVGLWQAGVRNVVATCGTAVTENHVRRLALLVNRVVVLFDGDSAGRAAAAKTFPLFLNSGLDAHAVFLPEEDDPDSIARAHGEGSAAYIASLERVSLLDCYVRGVVRRHGAEDARGLGAAAKGKIATEVAELLARVKNGIEQAELVQQASLRLMIDAAQLGEMVSTSRPGGRPESRSSVGQEIAQSAVTGGGSKPSDTEGGKSRIEDLPRVDQELVGALIGLVLQRRGDLLGKILHDADLCLNVAPATLRFVQGVGEALERGAGDDGKKREALKALLKDFDETWTAHWKRSYQMIDDPAVDFARTFEECRRSIVKSKLNQAVKDIDRLILTCPDENEKIALLQEKVALTKRIAGG